MNVTEELLEVIPILNTTTAKDLFNCVETALEDLDLPWEKLCSVATDGAPAMVGIKSGLIKLIKDKVNSLGVGEEVIGVHCLIHRENLCAKSVKLKKRYEHRNKNYQRHQIKCAVTSTIQKSMSRIR